MSVSLSVAAPSSLLGVFASLFSRWEAEDHERPKLPEAYQPMVTLGRTLLAATNVRDADQRLESALLPLRELLRRFDESEAIAASVRGGEGFNLPLPEDVVLTGDSPIERALGVSATTLMQEGVRLLVACIAAMRSLIAKARIAPEEIDPYFVHAFTATPWSLHDGEIVPHSIIEIAILEWKGMAAFCALVAAIVEDRQPERWLCSHLARAFLDGVTEFAKITAAGGYPATPKFQDLHCDFATLFKEAQAAELAALLAMEHDDEVQRQSISADESR